MRKDVSRDGNIVLVLIAACGNLIIVLNFQASKWSNACGLNLPKLSHEHCAPAAQQMDYEAPYSIKLNTINGRMVALVVTDHDVVHIACKVM